MSLGEEATRDRNNLLLIKQFLKANSRNNSNGIVGGLNTTVDNSTKLSFTQEYTMKKGCQKSRHPPVAAAPAETAASASATARRWRTSTGGWRARVTPTTSLNRNHKMDQ